MRIFLSGGTHGDWQDRVREVMKGKQLDYFDPRSVSNLPMKRIAEEERVWLDECDCLFFYFEESNPSGLGSAFEVGYCIAKGIPVIYVDEKKTSHSEWLGYHCSRVTHSLEDGIVQLCEIIEMLESRSQ